MTPEEFEAMKQRMEKERNTWRDESLYIVQLAGKKYNLYDGAGDESLSPMGYYSAEALLNAIESELDLNSSITIEKVEK